MSSRQRTILGIVLFLPLAAILFTSYACLPVPVGDPDTAKVDPQLVGAYRAESGDGATILVLLRPWDAKTYLVHYLVTEKKEGKESYQQLVFKAWLTTLADRTFICCQPLDSVDDLLGKPAETKLWVVMRLDKTATGIEGRTLNPEAEFFKNLTTREQFENAIKAHVSDQVMYGEALAFNKLAEADRELIETTMAKFNLNPLMPKK